MFYCIVRRKIKKIVENFEVIDLYFCLRKKNYKVNKGSWFYKNENNNFFFFIIINIILYEKNIICYIIFYKSEYVNCLLIFLVF